MKQLETEFFKIKHANNPDELDFELIKCKLLI